MYLEGKYAIRGELIEFCNFDADVWLLIMTFTVSVWGQPPVLANERSNSHSLIVVVFIIRFTQKRKSDAAIRDRNRMILGDIQAVRKDRFG